MDLKARNVLGGSSHFVYLVGGIPIPLKNMSPSIGMMTVPISGKINHVPNQPDITG